MSGEAVSNNSDLQIHSDLQRVFHEGLPSASAIAEGALQRCLLGREQDADWMKDRFSTLVESVQASAQEEYRRAQQRAGRAAFASVLLPLVGEQACPADFVALLGDNFHALDRFFAGLTQGRRSHTGKAFELLVCQFISLHYSYTSQAVIHGQPDWVFPSVNHLRDQPADTIVFSAKKTIKDRWRQMVTDATQPLGLFLGTLDEDLPSAELEAMHSSRVYAVVTTRAKLGRREYASARNVLTFEEFFRERLDTAVDRWVAAGLVAAPVIEEEPVQRFSGDPFAEKTPPEMLRPTFSHTRETLRRALRQPSLFD
ncbi:MAG: type II restriction endonuclease [Terriglobales bacterium]